MNAVTTIKPHLSNIVAPDEMRNLPASTVEITHLAPIEAPRALRELPAWVIWKFEPHENPGGKPRKVPYYVAGGRRFGDHGTPEDRRQLTTFATARAAAARRGFDGVGFATLAEFGVCALDFDNCVGDGGEIVPEVQDLLGTTYAELSPSGHGVRAFFRGQLGNRKSSKGWPFGMETFSTNGFVTFTGNVLPICELMGNADEVAPVDEPVLALYEKRFSREIERQQTNISNQDRLGLTEDVLRRALAAIPQEDDPLDYDQWLMVGMALHHETNGEGFELWDEFSQRSNKYTSPEYGHDRWRSFDRGTGPIVTARSLVHLANEYGAGINLSGPASMEEFESLENTPLGLQESELTATDSVAPSMRFPVLTASDFANKPAPSWIIKHVLPEAELVVLYGASGSGKTFMALDMCGCIARGLPWRGKKVKQGRVVYIAAEGAGGFRNRMQAYAQHNSVDLDQLNIGVINAAPNFLEKVDALDVARSIKASGGADVVVVDTFAQVMPGGNENAGEDMGKAMAHCKGIHRATGAVVILIHHAGKDSSKGARGWSGLRAAADAELEVVRTPTGRLLRLSKQKDGEDNVEWGFDLDIVRIGVDEDLEPITSCVVIEAAIPAVGGIASRKLGVVEAVVNAVIQEFAAAQTEGIEVGPVLAESVKRMEPPVDGKRDTRRMRARKALESLCNCDDAPYWLGDDGCIAIC